ncbi:hypothetical protein D9757_008700 [Collybiopsis confluens]|uniref:AMP-dependent synthetase/ligase domain-containing protein n=1 Tax=Collybiopsis confluens TaxID=2823264 RepID=A0A8H5H944_9AGAR|nr:hypothetical protein D9757_008700 [Collybiopsis confluens]
MNTNSPLKMYQISTLGSGCEIKISSDQCPGVCSTMVPSVPLLKPGVYPVLGESQLNLPDLLDFHLEHNPSYPLYIYADPEGSGSGSSKSVRTTTEIKALEYVRAVHRVANFIWKDGNSKPGDVIGLVVNIDSLLYSVLIVGIIKAGMVPFPMSPRNSSAALLHLMRKTSVHRLITSTSTQPALKGVIDDLKAQLQTEDASYELNIEQVPPFGQVFPVLGRERAEDPFVPFDSRLVESPPKNEDKGLYLHSSGSTGFPKPILFTHRIIKDNAAASSALPTFHMMGFCFQILTPLYGLVTTAIFAPTMGLVKSEDTTGVQAVPTGPIVATPESVLEAARIIKLQAMVVVPSLIHAWAVDDEAVEFLKSMRYLGFGGGPLAPRIAESLLARGVPVQAGYGGTEFGIVTVCIVFSYWY